MRLFYVFGLIGVYIGLCHAKGQHKVFCSPDLMRVEIQLPSSDLKKMMIYLDGMKGYPNPKCHPKINDTLAEFKLSLSDIYECGVTRVVNKITGRKIFYHKIIIEGKEEYGKEYVSVKCVITAPNSFGPQEKHEIIRRDTLPLGFQEPEYLEITTNVTGRAPDPILGVAVRQNGQLVTGDLNVSPGTPLAMEIFLDNVSAPIYGLGVTYMQVTDTNSQEETIIFNGCSVDPFLFENFNTVDGDFLTAKFRAFKFPESTYVQFRGTVNVCLDKCRGIQCSNGQIGYGRRRREISSTPDPNKVFEIDLAAFIKVDYDEKTDRETANQIEEKIKELRITNQKLPRNSRGSSVFESIHDQKKLIDTASGESANVEETSLFRTVSADINKMLEEDNFMNNNSNRINFLSKYFLSLIISSYVILFRFY